MAKSWGDSWGGSWATAWGKITSTVEDFFSSEDNIVVHHEEKKILKVPRETERLKELRIQLKAKKLAVEEANLREKTLKESELHAQLKAEFQKLEALFIEEKSINEQRAIEAKAQNQEELDIVFSMMLMAV